MKKILIFALALAALAGVAVAQMDQAQISVTVPTVTTNTGTATVKGEIYSIRLDCATSKTQGVAIVTAEGETILAVAALAADATYYPRIATQKNTDGAAITLLAGTNNVANPIYDRAAIASVLTMTVIGAEGTTGTNVTKAIITYKK